MPQGGGVGGRFRSLLGDVPVRRVCPVCGAAFEPHNGRQKYCCETCRMNAHRVTEKACAICGKVFAPVKSQVFCSKKCRGIAYRAKINSGSKTEAGLKAACLAKETFLQKLDRDYDALGTKVMTHVINGKIVEWRGQKVLGMNSTWGRVRY